MRFNSALLGTAVVLTLAAAGCKLNTDYFSEYRDKNLLGNYDFGAVDSTSTPKWSLALSTDFMTWEKIGATTNPASDVSRDAAAGTPTAGPDGVSPVYRMEIKNLIPNGDFEDTSVTPEGQTSLWTGSPSFWTAYESTANLSKALYSGTAPAVNGRSLTWTSGYGGDQLRLNLTQAVKNSSTTAWAVRGYQFLCDFINLNTGSTGLEMNLASTTNLTPYPDPALSPNPLFVSKAGVWTTPTAAEHTRPFSVSEFIVVRNPSAENWTLVFGAIKAGESTIQVVLDNLRLLPNDTANLSARASLPSLSSGTLPLLPGSKAGMFTFTVYIRDDPTAGASTDRSSLNRFQPKGLTIQLTAAVKSGSRQQPLWKARPTGGWPTWTKVSFDTGFDFVNSDVDLGVDPALTISLSPTQLTEGNPDVGSLLVSQPSLTFNP